MGTFVISQHPVKNCLCHVQSRGLGWVGVEFNWKGRVVGVKRCCRKRGVCWKGMGLLEGEGVNIGLLLTDKSVPKQ